MKNLYSVIFLFMAFTGYLYCQPSWYNATPSLLSHLPTRSTNSGAMMDINGDLVDDLLILDRGNIARWVQSSGKNFGLSLIDSEQTSGVKEWSLTAGDFDNSGKIDFLIIGNRNGLKRIKTSDSRLSSQRSILDIYAQASNTVDVNNDGFLDYYVCDDDGPNVIMINDGQGQLIRQDIIDFLENDPTNGSGNYGSEWVDVNGDLLPDLCIAKCSAFASEETDPRRINRVYINNGDGTFTEKAKELGLNSGAQSWVNAFGDIDNDGDQDVLIVNHYSPHQLMENHNGAFFTEIMTQKPISSFGFQAVMRDFDNDGFLDIFLTSVEGDLLLLNNGNKTFTEYPLNFGPSKATSFVVGDINDDGYLDIFAMMGAPINNVGVEDDQLWLGQANGNNYFKVNLEGKVSNRMGIGAQVELFGPWGQQTRYVKGGESYGIFNSLQQHFGLNKHEFIDSLIIRWPSGVVDVFKDNLTINSTFLAQEGLCLTEQISFYNAPIIVGNELAEISAENGYAGYLWSNGQTSQNIEVEEGDYFVYMYDTLGCKTVSKPINIVSGCFSGDKLIIAEPKIVFCDGKNLTIQASQAKSYSWSDGSTENLLNPTQSAWYYLTAEDYCGEIRQDSVYVLLNILQYELVGDSVMKGESALLKSNQPLTYWYDDNLQNLLLIGNEFQTPPLEETTHYQAQVYEIVEKSNGRLGEQLFPVTNLYGSNNISGDMIFDVFKPCMLNSFRVNTDTEGKRRIVIFNNDKEIIFSKEFDIKNGISTLNVNVLLQENQRYTLLTDTDINLSSLGFRSPRFVRTFNNTSFPYSIGGNISIIGSSFGPLYYHYFYDWDVDYDITLCESDFETVVAHVDTSSAIQNNLIKNTIQIHPNPFVDYIEVTSIYPIKSLKILDINGRVIYNDVERLNPTIDVQNLNPGIYFIQVQTDVNHSIMKVVKM